MLTNQLTILRGSVTNLNGFLTTSGQIHILNRRNYGNID